MLTKITDLSGSPRARHRHRRLVWNASLGTGCAAAVVLIAWGLDSPRLQHDVSLATAYVGLALLAATLLLGPWNVLRGRPNPLSTHLRRDTGIWAALVTGVHVAVGFQSHFPGEMLRWFRYPDREGLLGSVRLGWFGLGSWTGLAATLLLLILLSLSNNLSLRVLGPGRWKGWQRWNYVIFAAVLVHGVAFQVIEKRPWPWIALVAATAVAVGAFQAMAFRRIREGKRIDRGGSLGSDARAT